MAGSCFAVKAGNNFPSYFDITIGSFATGRCSWRSIISISSIGTRRGTTLNLSFIVSRRMNRQLKKTMVQSVKLLGKRENKEQITLQKPPEAVWHPLDEPSSQQ